MRNRMLMILLMGSLAGCSPSEEELEKEKTEAIRAAVEAGVRKALKDPDSARITVRQVFALYDGTVACGTVNAKNSFGGYTGEMKFDIGINPDGSPAAPTIANDEMSNAVFAAMCDFQKEYAARPGNAGKPSTPDQRKQLITAHEKRVREVVQEVASKR
ncbi:hypothetical protein SGMN_18190 [Stenotrophomonas geniculata]